MKITELRLQKLITDRMPPAPTLWDGPIAAVTRRAGLLKAQLGAPAPVASPHAASYVYAASKEAEANPRESPQLLKTFAFTGCPNASATQQSTCSGSEHWQHHDLSIGHAVTHSAYVAACSAPGAKQQALPCSWRQAWAALPSHQPHAGHSCRQTC